MIAKKEWFRPRIFGWGLRPVTREGWLYVAIAVLLFIGAMNLPGGSIVRITAASIIMAVFIIDSIAVMFSMYKSLDEREKKHQMVIEAAASYAAIGAMLLVLLYETLFLGTVNIGLLVVLGAMVVTKAVATIYVWKNG